MSSNVGFMQGRLSPVVDGKIQCFPWDYWQDEFKLAQKLNFPIMEWTLDQEHLHENPLLTSQGRQKIKSLSDTFGLHVVSVTGDCFMQAPFYKHDGVKRQQLLDDLSKILESCAELAIPNLLIPLVDGGRLENATQEAALYEGLQTQLGLIRDAGVKISFESDYEPEILKDFIAQYDQRLFGITYDIGNSASLGYKAFDELNAYADRVINVHVKDRLLGGTTVPLGSGNANFSEVFSLLKGADYQGNYILQTARAVDGCHAEVLTQYRDMVRAWI